MVLVKFPLFSSQFYFIFSNSFTKLNLPFAPINQYYYIPHVTYSYPLSAYQLYFVTGPFSFLSTADYMQSRENF